MGLPSDLRQCDDSSNTMHTFGLFLVGIQTFEKAQIAQRTVVAVGRVCE